MGTWLGLAAVLLIGPYGVTQSKVCEADVNSALIAAAPFLSGSFGDFAMMVVPLPSAIGSQATRLRDQADQIEAKDAAFKQLRDLAQCAMWKAESDKIQTRDDAEHVSIDFGSMNGGAGTRWVCVNSNGDMVLAVGKCPEGR